MITPRSSEERGHANHGWLDARHTFSFADYYDPKFVHFGVLRVLNQDIVKPGQGFGTHSHADMEIITYVLDGVLEHKDSMGNGSQILPGDVQVMSAGSGVTHSEFNGSNSDLLELLQMWIFPRVKGTKPRYEQRTFPHADRQGALRLLVSSDGEQGSLTIDQEARLFGGLLDKGQAAQLELPSESSAWLHVARGRLRLGSHEFGPGDGAAIENESLLTFEGEEQAEFLLWVL